MAGPPQDIFRLLLGEKPDLASLADSPKVAGGPAWLSLPWLRGPGPTSTPGVDGGDPPLPAETACWSIHLPADPGGARRSLDLHAERVHRMTAGLVRAGVALQDALARLPELASLAHALPEGLLAGGAVAGAQRFAWPSWPGTEGAAPGGADPEAAVPGGLESVWSALVHAVRVETSWGGRLAASTLVSLDGDLQTTLFPPVQREVLPLHARNLALCLRWRRARLQLLVDLVRGAAGLAAALGSGGLAATLPLAWHLFNRLLH